VTAAPQPNSGSGTAAAAPTKFLIAGFAPGSAALNAATKQAVTSVKPSLASATKIVITGLTTGSMASAANQALANQRALSAKAFIQALVGTKVRIVIASPKSASSTAARVRGVRISVHS
jgi:outer membrane protein OmpA-like peptidoglycan-associated protein